MLNWWSSEPEPPQQGKTTKPAISGCFTCPVDNVSTGPGPKDGRMPPGYSGYPNGYQRPYPSQRSNNGFDSTRSGGSTDLDTDRAGGGVVFNQRVFMNKTSPPKSIPRLNLGANKGTPRSKPTRSTCMPWGSECLEMDLGTVPEEPHQHEKHNNGPCG